MAALESILAAIRADPDDDEPRLVYADALQARGDPRGELIAVQCMLAREGLPFGERADLRVREHALLERARATLGPVLGAHARGVEFRRGFVEAITISAAKFIEHREAIFVEAPCLRRLDLAPLFAGSDGYGYDEGDTDPILHPIAALLDDPRIDGLAIREATVSWTDGEMSLRTGSRSAADDIAEFLCTSGRIAGLRELELGDSSSALARLCRSEGTQRLEGLTLGGRLETRRLRVEGPLRPRTLHLPTWGVELALDELCASTLVERVDDLELARLVPGVTNSDIPLLRTPLAPRLRSLCGGLHMTSDECSQLAEAPELARLEQLELSGSAPGQQLARYAKGRRGKAILGEAIDDVDLAPLGHAGRLDALRVLKLSDCVTKDGAVRLLSSPLARRLEQIDLRHNAPLGARAEQLAARLPGLVLLPEPKPKRSATRRR